MTILVIALMCFVWPLVLVHSLISRRQVTRSQSLLKVQNRVRRCRDIINFSYAGTSLNLSERLQLRAGPNKRLIQAFGIINSFTTIHPDTHNTFLLQAREPLQRMSQETWPLLFKEATKTLRRDLKAALDDADMKPECRLLLAQCVRRLCFRIVFSILFGNDPAIIQCQDVDIITEEINTQWLLSKRSGPYLLVSTMRTVPQTITNSLNFVDVMLEIIEKRYKAIFKAAKMSSSLNLPRGLDDLPCTIAKKWMLRSRA